MDDRGVGHFVENPPSRVTFSYDENWFRKWSTREVSQISLSLPVLPSDQSRDTTSFVAGLLPDSVRHRNLLAAEMGIEDDPSDFAFLAKMGRDAAGALTVIPEDESLDRRGAPSIMWPEDGEFADHLRSLPRRPLLFDDEEGVTLTLAGVNDKTAVVASKGRISLPQNGFPSSHIVKVDISGLEDSIRTEQVCLDAARGIGFKVPKSRIVTMSRYDREIRDGSLTRVHQEDFCQALGVMPAKKYQRHGDPGWPECFELILRSSDPLADRRVLLNPQSRCFPVPQRKPRCSCQELLPSVSGRSGRRSPVSELRSEQCGCSPLLFQKGTPDHGDVRGEAGQS